MRSIFILSLLLLLTPAWALDIEPADAQIKTTGAKEGRGWNLWSNGFVGCWIRVRDTGKYKIRISAKGDEAAGVLPIMTLSAGLKKVAEWKVKADGFREYSTTLELEKGTVLILVGFVNDYFRRGEDRNLHLRLIKIEPTKRGREPEFADEPDWRKEADERIERIRKGELCVRVVDGDGKPIADTEVFVEQRRHEFAFGTAICAQFFLDEPPRWARRPAARKWFKEAAAKYRKILKEYFNWAVIENAFKWHNMERQMGKPDYAAVDAAVEWCTKNGIPIRGHCIFWASERYVPKWAKRLSDEDLRRAIERRIRRDLKRYKGKIPEYDVNNEMVTGHYFENRLGFKIRVEMFKLAKEVDPEARLFVNDFSILNGSHLDAYERQIERLLKAGAPIDGIGCQGHFGEKLPPMWLIKAVLDRLSRFGLPIRVTEFDINTDDEKSKSRQLVDFYRMLFSHPSVDGILMWGFWAGRHWCPKAALFDREFNPRPSALAFKKLIFKEWWTKERLKTDGEGRCSVRAFYGDYRVTVKTKDGRSRTVECSLKSKEKRTTVTVELD